MDTWDLEENLVELLIKISVDIKCKNELSRISLDHMDRLLKKLNESVNNEIVSRYILKYVWNTYTDILSLIDLLKSINKKYDELQETCIVFEKYIADFLASNVTENIEEDLTSNMLSEYLKTLDLGQEFYDLLERIRIETANELVMSKRIAYYLFILERELLWRSSFFNESNKGWNELENEDEKFKQFCEVEQYVSDIFQQKSS